MRKMCVTSHTQICVAAHRHTHDLDMCDTYTHTHTHTHTPKHTFWHAQKRIYPFWVYDVYMFFVCDHNDYPWRHTHIQTVPHCCLWLGKPCMDIYKNTHVKTCMLSQIEALVSVFPQHVYTHMHTNTHEHVQNASQLKLVLEYLLNQKLHFRLVCVHGEMHYLPCTHFASSFGLVKISGDEHMLCASAWRSE